MPLPRQPRNTPGTAIPSFCSTTLQWFHASPIARCSIMMMRGVDTRSRPHASHTMTDEKARSRPIVVQTIGKVRGGGIHDGLRFSLMALFSPLTVGLRASRGENTRLLMLTTRKNRVTMVLAASSPAMSAGRGMVPDARAPFSCCRAHKAAVMAVTWVGMAAAYLTYPVGSNTWRVATDCDDLLFVLVCEAAATMLGLMFRDALRRGRSDPENAINGLDARAPHGMD
mmetsp:Transcript_24578/g.53710  ORF Transcript_24578/g.53710 Transcript_24578/m.53710 type:complete len:227 (+) Transcript_24578:789-1469(+)